jgi:hypothetical protein
MTRNSLICKLIKAQARIPENKENKIENEHELSKLTTAPPKDTAAFDNNNVMLIYEHRKDIFLVEIEHQSKE